MARILLPFAFLAKIFILIIKLYFKNAIFIIFKKQIIFKLKKKLLLSKLLYIFTIFTFL